MFCPLGSHVFKVNGRSVDETGRDLHTGEPFGFYQDLVPSHDILRINHYHVRAREQYEHKAARGYFGIHDDKLNATPERFEKMWEIHDKNDVFDDSARFYAPLMNFYLR